MISYIKTLSEKGNRIDGRKDKEFRSVKVEYGVSEKAEGSARAMIGNTEVIAGVKMKVGVPYPDSPDQGVLITTGEMLPLSSPKFLPGPPKENAIELSRIIDRGIRESKMIDLKKLCVRKGELVWTIFLDMYSINDDGNLIDTAALAALAALKSAVFPKLEGDTVIYDKFTKDKLPVKVIPFTTTIAKIGDNLFVDPSSEEEEDMDSRLSIGISDKGDIHAMQLNGNIGFTVEEINKSIEMSKKSLITLKKALK